MSSLRGSHYCSANHLHDCLSNVILQLLFISSLLCLKQPNTVTSLYCITCSPALTSLLLSWTYKEKRKRLSLFFISAQVWDFQGLGFSDFSAFHVNLYRGATLVLKYKLGILILGEASCMLNAPISSGCLYSVHEPVPDVYAQCMHQFLTEWLACFEGTF